VKISGFTVLFYNASIATVLCPLIHTGLYLIIIIIIIITDLYSAFKSEGTEALEAAQEE